MFFTTLYQDFSVIFGTLVFLVAASHSIVVPQQDDSKNDCKATGVESSLLANQQAVLRLLNESSTSCSLQEKELEDLRDLTLELDVKIREMKNDLLNMKNELQTMTAASLEIRRMKEEAKQDLKEVVLNATPQVPSMTTTTPSPIAANLSITMPPVLGCEHGWNEYQSSCYKLFQIPINHVEAIAACRAHGAYLASIGSEEENNFVHDLIVSWTYIGLSDVDEEGVFTWQDGSPFNYSKWQNGQPNNHDENEDCVNMKSSSFWADYSCLDKEHYICEKRLE